MTAPKPIVLLPVPMDSPAVWSIFRSFIDRFTSTWRQFPPGIDLDLVAILSKADPTPDLWATFSGLPVRFLRYDGDGFDLGCHQWFARVVGGNPFLICCTSRMYFHRAGWGEALVRARETHGPGLYGLSASHESGKLHLCTRGYCLDAEDFRKYPTTILFRDQGVFFECGAGCLLEWFESQNPSRPPRLVYWDGAWEKPDWFTRPNSFRSGDQSNMLIWDKHTDVWASADEAEKKRLSDICFNPPAPCEDSAVLQSPAIPLPLPPVIPQSAPRVITACDARLWGMLEMAQASHARLGYRYDVYSLDATPGLPFEIPAEHAQFGGGPNLRDGKIPFKPQIIRQALINSDPPGPIVWMDADAFAIRRFDELFTADYDVAVTMRRPEERNATCYPSQYGFLNAGVLFFNPTLATHRFLDLWIAEVAKTDTRSDQEALNRIVLRATDLTRYNEVFTLEPFGIRIKVLACDDYNWFYFPEAPPDTAKIVHLKTDRRAAGLAWAKANPELFT